MTADPGFYSIIDYTVDGPRTQRELAEAFVAIQERWVRPYPGYRSARLLGSVDGTRLYNIIHWASEEHFRQFEATSDTAGRMTAIQQAITGLSGAAEVRMTESPRYVVLHEVGPGPALEDIAATALAVAGNGGGAAVSASQHVPQLGPNGRDGDRDRDRTTGAASEAVVTVEVYADILCPWCAIGRHRLAAAIARLDEPERVEVVWRSFELDPRLGSVPGATASEQMRAPDWWGADADARIARIRSLGAAEGLELNLHLTRPVRSFDAHRLVHLATEHGRADEVMAALLHAYHTGGRNIADPDELVRIATGAGLDPVEVRSMLASDAHADAVRADQRQAAERGVRGVPTLVIDDGSPVPGIQPVDDLHKLLRDAVEAHEPVPG